MQEELFHDDLRDALSHAVKALGGFQAVAAELWPAKTLKASENWLRDCLSPERPAKLDIDEIQQILKMGRERGVHCAMYELCDAIGYERPRIVSPRTRAQELASKFQRKAHELQLIADEMAAAEHVEAAE